MWTREWEISLTLRTLDDETIVAEPLLFPEVLLCDQKLPRQRRLSRELAEHLLKEIPAGQLYQREMIGEPIVAGANVKLEPPAKSVDWVEPVELRFPIVKWKHGKDAHLAFVPALGIEVIARRQVDLDKLIVEQITAALRRTKIAASLFELAMTQRETELSVESLVVSVPHQSPKHREQSEQQDADDKPVIKDVGLVLNEHPLQPAYEVEPLMRQIADLLTGRSPRSVLLVGPSGCGKTAAVHELVRNRELLGLATSPFWSTSGARLIAGMSGYGMWQQRCQRLCREAARDGAILHVGNLVELMEVGRGAGGQGIAAFLRQYLARGEVLVIAECTFEQLAVIERQDAYLAELFHQVRVEEPTTETGRRILREIAKAAGLIDTTVASPFLATLDRLHRRYTTYSALPGREVRFLENLIRDCGTGAMIESRDVIQAFSRETGLPLFLLDPDVPLDLDQTRQWFTSRVIGQKQAIDLMVDLLATVKAAMTRPRRPIASLLFVGPTGVGKTEMAKAIAEFLFGDRNRLTRFDMSEFASAHAVERLTGTFGSEGLLTAKVREQPFSVLLFDEFEKAYHGFFDLLLQILGEGRLTDAGGRLGDFSNTIVIMTSNLGAESFGRGGFGLAAEAAAPDAQEHFLEELRAFVRPELFNRIDRVVPFLPLTPQTILAIANREIDLIRKRDGIRIREGRLAVSEDAIRLMSENGYDVRYGARPLKRAIERELLVRLADGLNSHPAATNLDLNVTRADKTLAVDVRAHSDESTDNALRASQAAQAWARLRRDTQKLQKCATVLAIQNQLFMLEREQRRKQAKATAKRKPIYDAQRAAKIKELREVADAVQLLSDEVSREEDSALLNLYGDIGAIDSDLHRLGPMRAALDDLLLVLLARQMPSPDAITIGVLGDHPQMFELTAAYAWIAEQVGYDVGGWWYSRHGKDQFRRKRIDNLPKFLESPDDSAVAMALRVRGRFAALRFSCERGFHLFEQDDKRRKCLVDATGTPQEPYFPPHDQWVARDFTAAQARRVYQIDAATMKDSQLDKQFRWTGRDWQSTLKQVIEEQLRTSARAILDQ